MAFIVMTWISCADPVTTWFAAKTVVRLRTVWPCSYC